MAIIFVVISNIYYFPKTILHAASGINKMVSYQGKLTDEDNIPVADGSYNLKISVYDSASGGNCLWTWKGSCGAVTAVPVTVSNGIFNVMLGDISFQSTNALNLDFNTDAYYLGVTVSSDAEMTPRKRLGAAGYSYNSDTLDGIHASSTATANYILPLDGNVDFSLPDDSKVVFRDSGIFLQSNTDGKLLLSSDGIGADDISLSGTVSLNSTLTVATSQTITGTADGTDAMTLTTGDITVSDGDLDVSGGDFNVTLDAGDHIDLVNSASTGLGPNLLHIANTTGATNADTVATVFIDTTFSNYADDGVADDRAALNITVTNNATDAGTDDNIAGISVQDLLGSNNAYGNEFAIYQAGTSWDYGLYITDDAYFGKSISILESTGATYKTTIQGGDQAANLTYTLPTAYPGVSGYVLSSTNAGVMSWVVQSGGVGDITDVGSMTTGAAFADSSADDDWLGLGAGAGRIEFDDQAIDEVNILSAKVGVGTQTPGANLEVEIGSTSALTGLLIDQQDLDQIGMWINSSASATATMLTLSSANVSGNLLNEAWSGSTTLTGNASGINIDMSNVTPVNNATNNIYGISINNPATNNSSTAYGLYVQGTNWDFGIYNADDTYFAGTVGVNTTGADRKVDILDASNPQLRLTYTDGTVYSDFQTTSGGNLYLAPSAGNVGINTNNPGAVLDINISFSGETTNNKKQLQVAGTKSFNTTSGVLTNYGAYFANTSTRSAGANNLTNIGLYIEASGAQVNYALVTNAGYVGIGTVTPAELFSVGSSSQFTIDINGNITKINNIAYSWPSAQGTAGDVLTNNGSGTLSWVSPSNRGVYSNLVVKNVVPDSYTKLLLHAKGADASTTFLDSSESTKTLTSNGNVQIDTAQSKFDSSSALFDGSGDSISFSNSEDFHFGTGSFTIDTWVRFNSLDTGAGQNLFAGYINATGSLQFYWLNGNFHFWYVNKNIVETSGLPAMATNTWYHVALVRNGNSWNLYLNGTSYGSATDSTDLVALNHVNGTAIGREVSTDGQYLNGWIDEFRVSKGIARWTTNFTAPSSEYEAYPQYKVDITADSLGLWDGTNTKEARSVDLTADITVSGANGLDTGAEGSSTWYYVWVIEKPDATTASLLSTSSTSPTMPSGYTFKKLVGAVRNDSSGHFIGFTQNNGKSFYTLGSINALTNGTATSYTAVNLSGYVPSVATFATLYWEVVPGGTTAGVLNSYLSANGTGLMAIGQYGFDTHAWTITNTQLVYPMNEARTIYYKSDTSNGWVTIYVQGFELNL